MATLLNILFTQMKPFYCLHVSVMKRYAYEAIKNYYENYLP